MARALMALQHCDGGKACQQPIAPQVMLLGKSLPIFTSSSTRSHAYHNHQRPPPRPLGRRPHGQTTPTPMACGREVHRLDGTGVRTLSTPNAIFEGFPKAPSVHQPMGACACCGTLAGCGTADLRRLVAGAFQISCQRGHSLILCYTFILKS